MTAHAVALLILYLAVMSEADLIATRLSYDLKTEEDSCLVKDVYFPNVERSSELQVGRADHFAYVFTGYVIASETGNYEIETRSDDGIQVNIGGKMIIDDWSLHAERRHTGSVTLLAGEPTPIRVSYYERDGISVLILRWILSWSLKTPHYVSQLPSKMTPGQVRVRRELLRLLSDHTEVAVVGRPASASHPSLTPPLGSASLQSAKSKRHTP